MVGTLKDCIEAEKVGVTDFCINGKCSECGACCSALLPVSDAEIRDIKRFINKKHIKIAQHCSPAVKQIDLTCPFLDESKSTKKCLVYPVRPKICRFFQCNMNPKEIRINRDMLWKRHKGVYMWGIDWTEV